MEGKMSRIYIVGMGPGAEKMMTPEAYQVLQECDTIVGYQVYLNLLGEEFQKKSCSRLRCGRKKSDA